MFSSGLEMCHCGHHKDTHFEKKAGCLGMHCDDCKEYRDAEKPLPPKVKAKDFKIDIPDPKDDPDYFYGWPIGYP